MGGLAAVPPIRSNARVPANLHTVIERAAGLLYPARCVGCGRFGAFLCAGCAAGMVRATGAGRCPRCAAAWTAELNCPPCLPLTALDRCLAAFEMEGVARQAVHALKYLRTRALVPVMVEAMGALREMQPFDAAIAVPLHPARLRERGFNQADELLAALDWPRAEGTLRRVRNTKHQVGAEGRERRANVAGAFAYRGPRLDGLTVAIIDDVITTGATVDECAAVLRDQGARSVVAVAYARAS